jgi:hypothetical protein
MLKTVLASSSFWAAVLMGVVTGLFEVGVIDGTVRDQLISVGIPYILFRVFGDTAKAVNARRANKGGGQ